MDNTPRITPSDGRVGVLLPGFGAVATTVVAGVEADVVQAQHTQKLRAQRVAEAPHGDD